MKLITLKCPNCDAVLEVQDGLDTFYCMYCGNKIMLEGMSKNAYRSKTKIKEMEHKERILDKQNEQERFRINQEYEETKRNDKIVIGILLLFLFICVAPGGIAYIEHKKNLKDLREIECEINEAINNQEYDNALLLANQLYYDDNWFATEEDEEAWDTKRENYIDMILERKRKEESTIADYILVPDEYDKLVGKKYTKVVDKFKSAGFTNVIAKVSSKQAGLFDFNETVEHITISGKSSFTKNETFDKDSAVVIYYYSK